MQQKNSSGSDITIVIVNYRVQELVDQLLDSLKAAKGQLELNIVVVDNDPGESAAEYLQARHPEIHVISNQENMGFSKASNQGIDLSSSPYTLIINPDTLVDREALQIFYNHMEENPQCALSGGRLLSKDGVFAPESRRYYITIWSSICALLGLHYLFPESKLFAQRYLGWLSEDQRSKVPVISGACMFWRTEVLKDLEGFDEQFFLYAEDDDICLRLKDTGFYAEYLPDAIITHYKGMSKRGDQKAFIKSFTDSLYLYFKKHYPSALNPLYKGVIYLAFLMKISAASIRKSNRADQL